MNRLQNFHVSMDSIIFSSILSYSLLFSCILFYSLLFSSILFYSLLYYSILFYSESNSTHLMFCTSFGSDVNCVGMRSERAFILALSSARNRRRLSSQGRQFSFSILTKKKKKTNRMRLKERKGKERT